VDGQQVTAVGGEYNTASLLNVDKTEGYGLETDIQWTPTGHWLMTFGASWNPTEIKDANLTVAPCGGGCTVTDPVVDGLAYVDGNPLPHAPDVIFNGIINWRSNVASKGFFGTLDWSYYSEKNFFLYESEEFKGDSFELGLRFGYAFNQGRYEVAAFARNLTDEVNVRGGIDFNNLTGYTNDPRIIGVEFLLKF
jgi:iron complex outermembrane receptor protein